jgi:ketosteroid isomerase-like protein
LDYTSYVDAFNAGDDAALVNRFFAEDTVFQSGSRILRGRQALLDFLTSAHDGIRETLRPQLVLRDAEHIFAEIDIDFSATADKPGFQFGALRKGERTTVKFFVAYYLRDSRVAQLKAAAWPSNSGVSTPTSRLGGSPEQRQAFLAYTQAFSNADFAGFGQYYTDDVRLELPSMTIARREGIVGFYREMFKRVRESLTLNQLVADDAGIAADVTSQFTAIADAPDFVVAPLKKGEFVRSRVFVYYTLRDGQIAHIRVARFGQMSGPQSAAR